MSATTTTSSTAPYNLLDQLRLSVAATCVGAELPFIDHQVRLALNEFLRRTSLLRGTYAIAMVPLQADYVVPLPDPDRSVSVILSVFDQNETGLLTYSGHGFPEAEGRPRQVAMVGSRTMRVWPTPQDPPLEPMTIYLTVAETIQSTVNPVALPDVCTPWHDTLLAGVLTRMHSMSDKPWTSASKTLWVEAQWREGLVRARIASDTGRGRGGANWRYPVFGT